MYFEFTNSVEVPRIQTGRVARFNYLSLGQSGKPVSKTAGNAKSPTGERQKRCPDSTMLPKRLGPVWLHDALHLVSSLCTSFNESKGFLATGRPNSPPLPDRHRIALSIWWIFRSQIPVTSPESMHAKYTTCVMILHNHVYSIYTSK